MSDNSNIKNIVDIIDLISNMVLEYINEQHIREISNKNTS